MPRKKPVRKFERSRQVHKELLRLGIVKAKNWDAVQKKHRYLWNTFSDVDLEKFILSKRKKRRHTQDRIGTLLPDMIQFNDQFGPVTKTNFENWYGLSNKSADRRFCRILKLLEAKKIPFTKTCSKTGESGIILKITLRDVDKYTRRREDDGEDPPQQPCDR